MKLSRLAGLRVDVAVLSLKSAGWTLRVSLLQFGAELLLWS